MPARRSYGTGSLTEQADSNGRVSWYAQWREGTRKRKKCLGPKRADGAREGLIRAQAEAKLRVLMAEARPVAAERLRSPRPASGTSRILRPPAASAPRSWPCRAT